MIRIVRALALAALASLTTFAPALAAPHAGDAAAPFDLPNVGGGTLSLQTFKGKPTYVNFFASWCGPCNAEAASVATLYKKYHPRGLATLGVNEQEDASKARAFAQKYRWPFAIGTDDGTMGRAYGALALPVHVFVDRTGKVSTYRLGEMAPAEIEDAIKKIVERPS